MLSHRDRSRLLLDALTEGDPRELRAHLRAGADPEIRSREGVPAVLMAAASGRQDLLRAMLEAGAALGATHPRTGRNLGHLCADSGDVATLEWLHANAPAVLLAKDFAGNGAFDVALRRALDTGDPNTLAFFLTHYRDIPRSSDRLPIACEAAAANSGAALNALAASHPQALRARSARGWTCAHYAAAKPDALRAIIQHAPEILDVAASEDGRRAMHIAAMRRHPECVQLLIAAGACVRCTDAKGATPAFYAEHLGAAEIGQLLAHAATREQLSERVSPNTRQSSADTTSGPSL